MHDLLLKHAKRATTFMVRDFQSRNIMLANGSVPYLIDFQGGRRGPVEYDVASFLWQAKAGIPKAVRDAVIDSYVKSARFINPAFDEATFRGVLPYFVLFRILQTLGAYGYRGISEGKSHFMASIPLALANLETHLAEYGLDKEFPYISDLAAMLRSTPVIQEVADRLNVAEYDGLTVTVTSFSYKKGFPADFSGNGGGFVFDCRAVHNPGRYDQYKILTGRDAAVKSFLEEDGEITTFLKMHGGWSMPLWHVILNVDLTPCRLTSDVPAVGTGRSIPQKLQPGILLTVFLKHGWFFIIANKVFWKHFYRRDNEGFDICGRGWFAFKAIYRLPP